MSTTPHQLYDEFLKNYGLEKGFYYHSIELLDHPFEKVEKVQAIRIGDTLVPLSPAVSNSVKFNVQLNLAPINAEKAVKKYIGSYKGLILDADDTNLFCFTAEEAVLKDLLWPFHLLTVQAELTEKDFFPLADMMEGIVCDTQEAIFGFMQAVLGSTDRIDAETEREIDRKNRQTDAWAANAPVEVRGSIRRYGNRIEVAATARSTVTSGMVNADYQVHSLVANQNANREKASVQRSLMNQLEGQLLAIIGSYKQRWYDRLRQLGGVIGKNVLRDTVCSSSTAFRPDQKENMIEIVKTATGKISFANLERLMRYYGYDCDDLFGHLVAMRIMNSLIKDNKLDTESFYYEFYGYFYDVEHPLQHEALFNRVRELNKKATRSLCERSKAEHPDFYQSQNISLVLSPSSAIIDGLLGITEKQRNRLSDDASSIFYDVLGDASMRDYYKNGAPRFEF